MQFCCPRPDDPSLELQRHLVFFFLECDSQHVLLCGNRRANVSADTLTRVCPTNYKGCGLLGVRSRSIFGEVTKKARRLVVSGTRYSLAV
jgi:hypothetical protein